MAFDQSVDFRQLQIENIVKLGTNSPSIVESLLQGFDNPVYISALLQKT
jgi:hypothetical protein